MDAKVALEALNSRDITFVSPFLISIVLKISRLQIAPYVSVRISGGNSLKDNYAYKKEVMTAVRELVEKVVIYASDDPEGRDVELIGDIEAPCLPTGSNHYSLGMEAMVHLKGEISNLIFAVLREWETTLHNTKEGPKI